MSEPENKQTPPNAPAADQSPAVSSDQQSDSKTSGKQPAETTEAQQPSKGLAQGPTEGEAPVPAPAVTPPVEQDAHNLKQAALLEHKPSIDGVPNPGGSKDSALAGGRSPQSPELISKLKSAKKSRAKKRDNHVSVRLTDDEIEILDKRMEDTGETQSDALRGIIREHPNKEGDVQLAPRIPPSQLEDFLGEISKWRSDFTKIQPRLNMPTPKSDNPRYKQVTEWRVESKRILEEIKNVEAVLRAAIGAVTSLTPRKVERIRKMAPLIQKMSEKSSSNGDKIWTELSDALLQLIDDMGLQPKL